MFESKAVRARCAENDRNCSLTAFDTEEAVREAYDRHVNCCVRKPSDLDQFSLAVKKIETFWLQMARIPRER